jgi:methylenetetrahydrofolate dehydrogenase (NADP+)/methenyltetrahydrofolate cyclohydrolase
VQLPLPEGFDVQYILDSIPKEKDIDVLSKGAVEAFYNGENRIVPPPVGVVSEITKDIVLEEKIVAVVGVGRLIGNPITGWLKGKCKELVVLRRGSDLGILKNADIVISGTGIPNLIHPDMVKGDAIIIDFGYGKKDGELCGDFDSSALSAESHITYTPTPGGTGPILVMKLMENFFSLAV